LLIVILIVILIVRVESRPTPGILRGSFSLCEG